MTTRYLPNPSAPDVASKTLPTAVGYVWTPPGSNQSAGARGLAALFAHAARSGYDVVDIVADTAPHPDLEWLRAVVELRGAGCVLTPDTARTSHVIRHLLLRRGDVPVILVSQPQRSAPADRAPAPFEDLFWSWLRAEDQGDAWRQWHAVRGF